MMVRTALGNEIENALQRWWCLRQWWQCTGGDGDSDGENAGDDDNDKGGYAEDGDPSDIYDGYDDGADGDGDSDGDDIGVAGDDDDNDNSGYGDDGYDN